MWHPVGCFRSLLKSFVQVRSFSVALLLFSGLLFWSAQSLADEQARAVRLSYVHGSVRVLMGNQTQFQQAYANMPLPEGTQLQTGNDGRAELQLEDGSIARLTPNSSLTLTQLRSDSDGFKTSEIEFLGGLAYFELQPQSGSSQTSIVYQQNRITASSFAVFRMNADNPPGDLQVLSGDLHLTGGSDFAVDAHANEQVRFDASNPNGYYLAQGISQESWDQWNGERDSALNQEAQQQTAATASASDPNNPAWRDLDTYGNWYDVEGYGQVWSPNGAGSDWDPYGSGYWANYPGYGYMWVSSYPWGYLPYRCGAWNYFNDFGWGWMPGGCGYGYMGGSIVVWNTPPGYVIPPHPILNRPVGGLVGSGSVVPVQRGGSIRYKPLPVHGVGGVGRPVTIAGQPVMPLPPVHGASGFYGTSGHNDGGSVIVGRTGITRPGRPPVTVSPTPGQPSQAGSATWNTVRPQPGSGMRPGQGSGTIETPHITAPTAPSGPSVPIQRTQPVMPAPHPITPSRPVQAPSSTPHIMPAPVITSPRVAPVQPSAPPRMSAPAPAPMPHMEAPRMSAPAPAPAPHVSAPSGPRR